MKLKILVSITALLICSMSFGQDFKNDLTSVKTIDDQIQEEEYNTNEVEVVDRLVVQTSVKNISEEDRRYYSKKEWKKIKKQILRNKEKFSSQKNGIQTFKTIDTIFLDIPIYDKGSLLSGW